MVGMHFSIGNSRVNESYGEGFAIEEAMLDIGSMRTLASADIASLSSELPSLETLSERLTQCTAKFARDMACGLAVSAIEGYDTGDLLHVGQAVVDWASTLEVQADRSLVRRMRRRRQARR